MAGMTWTVTARVEADGDGTNADTRGRMWAPAVAEASVGRGVATGAGVGAAMGARFSEDAGTAVAATLRVERRRGRVCET
jgi:hypothetical protein